MICAETLRCKRRSRTARTLLASLLMALSFGMTTAGRAQVGMPVPPPTPPTPPTPPIPPNPIPEPPGPGPFPSPPSPPAPVPPPPPPGVPDYSGYIPVNMAVPSLANTLGLAMLGTYHDRVGDYYPAPAPEIWCKDPARNFRCAPTPDQSAVYSGNTLEGRMAVWGRVFGATGDMGSGDIGTFSGNIPSDLARFNENGPVYEFNLGGVQLGMDLYRGSSESGAVDMAGLYLGAGTANANVDSIYGGDAGSTSMNGYSLGGYWTRVGPSGWYLDAVVQGTWYDRIKAESELGGIAESNGWGVAASIETGKPFSLGNGYAIEPEAQLVYQHIAIDGVANPVAAVDFDNIDALYGRLGARLTRAWVAADGRPTTIWARANIWQNLTGDNATTAFAIQGLNPARLETDLGGTWGQFGIGVSGQLTASATVFVSGDYNLSLGSEDGHSWEGRIGTKISW